MALSRRTFLAAGTAATSAAVLGGIGSLSPAQANVPSVTTALPGGPLVGARRPDLWDDLHKMVDLGPRMTGSPAHHAYIDWLASDLQKMGLQVERTTQSFTRWEPSGTRLKIDTGPTAGSVKVGAFYPYSGQTPTGGVTGKLIHVGTGSAQEIAAADLRGNIAVFDVGPLAVYPLAAFLPQVVSTYDPARSVKPTEPISFAFATPFPNLDGVKEAGAVGAIMLVDSGPDFVADQWAPDNRKRQDTPALILDRVAGASVRAAALTKDTLATLTLTAQLVPATTDMLVTVVPGPSDEVVILNTHTDGPNALQEPGGLIMRDIARALTRVPVSQRGRTFALVFTSAHFMLGEAGLESTALFIRKRPDLVSRAVAAFAVENIGPRQWVEQGNNYVSTGLTEPHFHITTPTPVLQELSASASRSADFRRTMVMLPGEGGELYGEGTLLHQAGVPTIQTISSPHRLVQVERGDVVETEVDRQQWNRGVDFSFTVASALAAIPTNQLKPS